MSEKSSSRLEFSLGPQPTWAGKEENGSFDASLIGELLKEDNGLQLITRGYCIVDLEQFDSSIVKLYSSFHESIEKFFQMPREYKEKYAMLQFENQLNSPNQCHGYSEVSTLKEQFMMRCVGYPNDKLNQSSCSNEIIDSNSLVFPRGCDSFGLNGMKIYEKLDLLCRQLAKSSMKLLNKKEEIVDDILDPIFEINGKCDNKHSNFMPNGYISSSIMDNFHYYKPSKEKCDRFHNNHASHTDSGLMTVVIVTDEPGLELFDQKLKQWLPIEELFHKYLYDNGSQNNNNKYIHRRYATCFWSDSVEYLNNAKCIKNGAKGKSNDVKMENQLRACFHRVKGCEKERYSVVFKQRTAPLRTHCRYQEDYILASIQSKVDKNSQNAYTLWKQQDSQSESQLSNWLKKINLQNYTNLIPLCLATFALLCIIWLAINFLR